MPWKRSYKWTAEGKYLGSFPYAYTPERAIEFLYSKQINHVPVRTYVAKSSGITSVKQLKGRKLCLPQSYIPIYQQMNFLN